MVNIPIFNPEIGFDITFNQFGGKWNLERVEEANDSYYKPFLRYCESIPSVLLSVAQSKRDEIPQLSSTKIPHIQTGILNSHRLNCYAIKTNETYHAAMSGMIPIALLELSSYFFSEDDFFPNIGEAEDGPLVQLDGVESVPFFQISENRFAPLVSKKLNDLEAEQMIRSICTVRGHARNFDENSGIRKSAAEYLDQFDTLIDLLLPNCLIRKEHCRYMASIMVHFFWYHEIAHITQGHLSWLNSEGFHQNMALCEFPDLEYPNLDNSKMMIEDINLLSMELDADIEATLLTIGTIMIDLDIESDEFPYVEKHERLELFVFMLIAVLGAFNFRFNRSVFQQRMTHPPAKIRLINIITYLMNFTDQDSRLTDAISKGLKLATELGQHRKFAYLRTVGEVSTEDAELLDKIDSNRQKIPSAYDELKYGNLRILITGWLDDNDFLKKMKL